MTVTTTYWKLEYIRDTIEKETKVNKHNAELQRTDPGTKDTGNLVPGVALTHVVPT